MPNPHTFTGDPFLFCNSLHSLVIPDCVAGIVDRVFTYSSLSSLVIRATGASIGDWAFDGCSSLNSLVIPDSVTRIGDSAFRGCTSLTDIVIPDSVTSIGDHAFANCSFLYDLKHELSSRFGDKIFW